MRLFLVHPLRTQNAVAREAFILSTAHAMQAPQYHAIELHAACNSAFESAFARIDVELQHSAKPSKGAIPTLFTLANQSACAPASSYGAS